MDNRADVMTRPTSIWDASAKGRPALDLRGDGAAREVGPDVQDHRGAALSRRAAAGARPAAAAVGLSRIPGVCGGASRAGMGAVEQRALRRHVDGNANLPARAA